MATRGQDGGMKGATEPRVSNSLRARSATESDGPEDKAT